MSRNLLAMLVVALLALTPDASHAAPQEVYELNFQSSYAGPHVLNLQLYQPWVKELNERSNGRLIVHFFMSGAIVKSEETLQAVKNGNIDIAGCGPQNQDTWFPYTLSFTVPYITNDSAHAANLFNKVYNTVPEVAAEWQKVGKVLTIWGTDRFGFFSLKDPILGPADLHGKRVLIWSGGQVDQVKAWGGIPVQVSINDTYMALQRGMGDLFFGPLPAGVASKLMEVSKNITVIPAATYFIAIVMNWDAWNGLPKDLQDLIDDTTGEKSGIQSGRMLYDATNRDIETMRAAGNTIHYLTDAQYQTFKDADREVTHAFWMKELKRLGVADPAAAIQRAYDMAAAVPTATGELSNNQ